MFDTSDRARLQLPLLVASRRLRARGRGRPLSLLTRFSRQLDRVSWRFNANRTGPVPVPRGFGEPAEPSCALVHNQSCSSHASSPPLPSIVPAIFTAPLQPPAAAARPTLIVIVIVPTAAVKSKSPPQIESGLREGQKSSIGILLYHLWLKLPSRAWVRAVRWETLQLSRPERGEREDAKLQLEMQ